MIKGEYSTLPEILKIEEIPLLFVEGDNDDHSVIMNLDKKNMKL